MLHHRENESKEHYDEHPSQHHPYGIKSPWEMATTISVLPRDIKVSLWAYASLHMYYTHSHLEDHKERIVTASRKTQRLRQPHSQDLPFSERQAVLHTAAYPLGRGTSAVLLAPYRITRPRTSTQLHTAPASLYERRAPPPFTLHSCVLVRAFGPPRHCRRCYRAA